MTNTENTKIFLVYRDIVVIENEITSLQELQMENLCSISIDGMEIANPRGFVFSRTGSSGVPQQGESVRNLDSRWNGWLELTLSGQYSQQVIDWEIKRCVCLKFKTAYRHEEYSDTELTFSECDDGFKILVEYRDHDKE